MTPQDLPFEDLPQPMLAQICRVLCEAIGSQTVSWNAMIAHSSVRCDNGLPVDREWMHTLTASASTTMNMLTADLQDILYVQTQQPTPTSDVADRLNSILASRNGQTISEDELRSVFEAALKG